MSKFLLKFFFITTVLFFGVILGIQLASNNIVEMTGDSSYSTEKLIKIDAPVYTPKTIDKELTSHDLETKQQKLEQIESFNLFSQMGVKLSELLNLVFSNVLGKMTTTLGDIMSGLL
jgi:hypothetical protein